MKKINILQLLNIIVPIILFSILLFSKISETAIYIMIMTIIVGWVIPYTVLLVTGLSMIHNKQPKLTLLFNVVGSFLSIILIIFCIYLYNKDMLILTIEYSIILLLNIINIIYYINYIKKNPELNKKRLKRKKESLEIKKIKEKNNGAIV